MIRIVLAIFLAIILFALLIDPIKVSRVMGEAVNTFVVAASRP